MSPDKVKIKDFKKEIEKILSSFQIGAASFGLDVGTFSVKAAEVKKDWMNKEKDFSFAVSNLNTADKNNSLVPAIKKCLQEAKITTKRVNLSFSGEQVITRYILMPKMQEKDLVNSLEFELAKYIPKKLDDTVVDFQIVDKSVDGQMAVLIAGAEYKFISEMAALVKEAGLLPQSINVASQAILSAFYKANLIVPKDKEAVAFLDMGHTVSKLSILEGGTLRFYRDVMIGGADLTRAISERLNIGMEEAEKIKCSPEQKPAELDSLATAHLNNILDEIRISFDYCVRFIQKNVSSLYLSGGAAKLKKAEDFLKKSLDIKVSFWDPTAALKLPSLSSRKGLGENSHLLPAAVGLAL
ncbi:MAG: hypothetical protein COV72_07760 [Candidatus Omnitrophica bacterium CG11_big_fil_rev_8_21_14_0_20_42_13]|uniref:SHS2 domain-containing protein n=1 Tax=Candidatus Ghiorseimicrobium undicola TaxID=1974746 RepID=A0A2H0LVY2_9BACT|nr:MAG: hypothetical protein COV72_07760 [Candidatus Omnitrophica bacterium CG11_big_fil_rev_8_21_14_0_20_42_13]